MILEENDLLWKNISVFFSIYNKYSPLANSITIAFHPPPYPQMLYVLELVEIDPLVNN